MSKHYVEYKLNNQLSQYVDCVWMESYTQLPENVGKSHLIVPDNTIELVITQNRFIREKAGNISDLKSHLSGLKTYQQTIKVKGNTLLSVRFKPEGLYPFSPFCATETINAFINPEDILGKDFRVLESQIVEKKSNLEKVGLVEQFLMRKLLSSTKRGEPFLEHLMHKIHLSRGSVQLMKLAKDMNISLKTIQRKFLLYIGITPKKYIRLVRFCNLIRESGRRNDINFIELAYKYGYSDQTHFIKDIKSITGKTPKQYLLEEKGIQENVFS